MTFQVCRAHIDDPVSTKQITYTPDSYYGDVDQLSYKEGKGRYLHRQRTRTLFLQMTAFTFQKRLQKAMSGTGELRNVVKPFFEKKKDDRESKKSVSWRI